ncbi:TetR/AcrR family transcriptional regulator [Streptomonospora wellingtoniae]|uniref:TetR/AcrR family transcriptional regulator n=1 Tax=Streptomonospora wellingtoniae TaxID=3075544 RepID=A0ABU2KUK4_9ACTN|nr:TetR/AcrR family transcriptional regulator [Streptomonospora sp. DSM 45055]MDT0302842.1 TetR/AcrR family transcriptional regulator [Streptomonospora sp. DSM 45055]
MTRQPTFHQVEAAPSGTRRERVRQATSREIKEIARRHLTAHGASGVSLRAIAREMGMTAPGLYRYFASLNHLLEALQAELFAELGAAVDAAEASQPDSDTDGRLLAALRAVRAWGLANRPEFALLFGPAGTPPASSPEDSPAAEAGQRFASTFVALFDRLIAEGRFTVPDEPEASPALCAQLDAFASLTGFSGDRASAGAIRVLLGCWVRFYGIVCMEVFQHLGFVSDDMETLFEAELRDLAADLGVAYRPPDAR